MEAARLCHDQNERPQYSEEEEGRPAAREFRSDTGQHERDDRERISHGRLHGEDAGLLVSRSCRAQEAPRADGAYSEAEPEKEGDRGGDDDGGDDARVHAD